jgi:hypothetical protein
MLNAKFCRSNLVVEQIESIPYITNMWQVYTRLNSASDFFNQDYETSQIFLKFKILGMKFGHLEQKLELSNQNMCKKFLKNNAHIPSRVKLEELM